MDTRERIKAVSKKVRFAPDSDDVAPIIRKAVYEAIDENVLGLQLRLFLRQLKNKLQRRLHMSKDYIELNNLKRGIDLIEDFERIFEKKTRHFEMN